jgi:hypothetical protein
MRMLGVIFLSCLLAIGSLCAADSAVNNPLNPAGHLRGKKYGNYTFKIVGQYSGRGACTITPTSVTISANIKAPNGTTGSIVFSDLPLVNDYFRGSTTFNGVTLNISGRIDMPAGTDSQQSPAQSITGRISAQLIDSAGKGARLVAIEDPASRALVPAP